ncbi:hypothetical protein FE784_28255 [Paenibacillus hemerocallicola]|uniref:DUF2642 domain-containing protein n=1 Tax=Paenibacillus hemerocallicola TaxID=1172614 RepID=A0A5C4T1J3_9BACL|nr:hypothetical protein [Paenibacillus hemerocallicola]TNJ62921.1 hypothetical protein FE784_28255 [Paenibacillus hemerocallicola]
MYRQFPQPQPPLHQKARSLLGRPVGLSLKSGQGVAGVLCQVQANEVFILQYLYQAQFATFHYAFTDIQDIYAFPRCTQGPY